MRLLAQSRPGPETYTYAGCAAGPGGIVSVPASVAPGTGMRTSYCRTPTRAAVGTAALNAPVSRSIATGRVEKPNRVKRAISTCGEPK